MIVMTAEGKAIIFYRLFFILLAWMKDQPWDLNQTWPVGQKWCQFTNTPSTPKNGSPPQIWGAKNTSFATSTVDTAHLVPEYGIGCGNVCHGHMHHPVLATNLQSWLKLTNCIFDSKP